MINLYNKGARHNAVGQGMYVFFFNDIPADFELFGHGDFSFVLMLCNGIPDPLLKSMYNNLKCSQNYFSVFLKFKLI